jgi:3-phosphoshikimate 1-carboxyvinyltransferase
VTTRRTVPDLPGDKSVSHRCLLLAAVAEGESRFENLNRGADVAATAAALAACGAELRLDAGGGRVTGGALRHPEGALDFANSGTGVRLAAGLLAGAGVRARLVGDASLSSRPMARVVEPLREMGLVVRAEGPGGTLPMVLEGGAPRPLRWRSPVASAQVKSCVLLAGLASGVRVEILEPAPTRDHTERLLRAMGAAVRTHGPAVVLEPGPRLRPLDLAVPGDFSAAAFLVALAILVPGLEVEVRGVGLNPGRTGLLDVVRRMGADVRAVARGEAGGEPVGDLVARHAGRPAAVEVPAGLVPRLVDEIPVLAVLAARARGTTVLRGLGELRVKESDRVSAIAAGLRAVGVRAEERGDDLEIEGTDAPLAGRVDTRLDHRIAMAFEVLGRSPRADVTPVETSSAGTSFPEFEAVLEAALR